MLITTNYSNGSVRLEEYIVDNKYHREDGPAKIQYDIDGSIISEEYLVNDKYHREDGPAMLYYSGAGKFELYFINDKPIKEIVYYDNGNMRYQKFNSNFYKEGESGPSRIDYYDNGSIKIKAFEVDGKLHNSNGPAYIRYYKNGKVNYQKYYINGIEYKEFEYFVKIGELKKLA